MCTVILQNLPDVMDILNCLDRIMQTTSQVDIDKVQGNVLIVLYMQAAQASAWGHERCCTFSLSFMYSLKQTESAFFL
jgi:hypothetical protein